MFPELFLAHPAVEGAVLQLGHDCTMQIIHLNTGQQLCSWVKGVILLFCRYKWSATSWFRDVVDSVD